MCRDGDGEPLRRVGNSAVVFKIDDGDGPKMLKCYTRRMPHLDRIYGQRLLRDELYVWEADGRGGWCDVLVDDWIEGSTLHEAMVTAAKQADRERLRTLAVRFDTLALELLRGDWAHGDLKPENILVDGEGKLHLVDFDAMFLPEFAGEKSPELGTAAYQHPARTTDDFDTSIDDYSIALISTTLHASALRPELLSGREEELLSPREVIARKSSVYTECLTLFERTGDAAHYRIARLLESPLMRLPSLKGWMEYAVHGVGAPADGGEIFVRDGYWGFRQGAHETIPPIYDAGFDFSEGLAAVRTGRAWHFIDTAGHLAIDCSDCEAVKPFAGGRAVAIRDGRREEIEHPVP